MVVAATTTQNIAVLIGVVLAGAWVVYLLWNVRRAGRGEVGAELELAPNRRPYFSDEVLEGRKLERTQLLGLAMLAVLAVGLPLYWLHEPARQAGATEGYDKRFAGWGEADFATTAEGGFNCAGCHGGMKATGGVAAYTITDARTGLVRAVNWTAPALNTVLYRFSTDEVTYILTYGRPFSPMSAWGTKGGGPMNDQQISNIIAYLRSIQVPQEGCGGGEDFCDNGHLPAGDAAAKEPAPFTQAAIQKAAEEGVTSGKYKSLGEALFNLDLNGGAFSCARCHTQGWSYGDPKLSGGGSALGPNLTNGDTVRQFPNEQDHIDFVDAGSEDGKKYGQQGQGSGRMPGFGHLLTDDQVKAIVNYERGL
jgi:mono/diheme cytochrome c family protein